MWIAQLVVNFTAGYTVSHDLNQLILKSYPTSVSNLLVATGRKNMERRKIASYLLAPTPVDKFTHSFFAKTGNSFSGLSRQTGNQEQPCSSQKLWASETSETGGYFWNTASCAKHYWILVSPV